MWNVKRMWVSYGMSRDWADPEQGQVSVTPVRWLIMKILANTIEELYAAPGLHPIPFGFDNLCTCQIPNYSHKFILFILQKSSQEA